MSVTQRKSGSVVQSVVSPTADPGIVRSRPGPIVHGHSPPSDDSKRVVCGSTGLHVPLTQAYSGKGVVR